MKISEKGLNLIISFEGFCPNAAKAVKTERYYTIGYGHYGKDVEENQTITKKEALLLLKNDVKRFESKVMKYNDCYNFTQNEFDALVSFAYNVGNIDQLTAKGTRTKKEIADAMLLYIKSGGNVLDGLRKRRTKERELFLNCSTSNFYPKYNGASKDIDIVLSSIGVKSSFYGNYKKRIPLAKVNGIKNYTGNLSDNIKLLSLAKTGNLKKVE
jgi:GH24 family phage-related lysozyme (muramidase)